MEELIDKFRKGELMRVSGDTGVLIVGLATHEQLIERLSAEQHVFSKRVVLVDDLHMLERFVPEFHEICFDLIETASRPLTIVYPSFISMPAKVGYENGEIPIRVVQDPFLQKLIRSVRNPLIALPDCQLAVAEELLEEGKVKLKEKEQVIRIGKKGEVDVLKM
jgi:L-threonylcarbamoyladenylate synthase